MIARGECTVALGPISNRRHTSGWVWLVSVVAGIFEFGCPKSMKCSEKTANLHMEGIITIQSILVK